MHQVRSSAKQRRWRTGFSKRARAGARFVRQRTLVSLAALALMAASAKAETPTVQLSIRGTSVCGTPVSWSDQRVCLLVRDGMLWQFAPGEAEHFLQISADFRPFSQSEMRGQLLQEFGRGYDVSGTGNYLVVHPAGQRDRWAPRFEALYRSFAHYFTARGMRPQRPQFPLVAVVFRSQADFARYAAQDGMQVQPGVLGFYSPASNRVLLYDVTWGNGNDEQWYVNAETIIHEATHQTAFNCGVHSRFAPRLAGWVKDSPSCSRRPVCGTPGNFRS